MLIAKRATGGALATLTLAVWSVSVQAVPLRAETTIVRGVVLDSQSRAAVPAATIRAEDRIVTADPDGRFAIALPASAASIDVAAPGYFPLIASVVDLTTSATGDVEVLLAPRALLAETVEVRGDRLAPAPQGRAVAATDVLHTPGAVDNIFRALSTLPGVAATFELGGFLSVRGGAPDQNLTVIDGVEVYDPYRLYGLATAFNPETVERFDLATGGFGVSYGDRLSSMLTVGTRDGAANRRFGGSASMSVTDANAVLEGGFPNGSWLLTGRRTYYDLVADLVSDQQFPGFTDLQGKAVWHPRPGASVTLFGLRSRQGGNVKIDETDTRASFYDDTENDLGWVRAQAALGHRGRATTLLAFSETRVGSGFEASLADKGRRSNAPGEIPSRRAELTFDTVMRVRDLSARQELGWGFGRASLGTGFEVHRLKSMLDFALTGDRNPNAANGSSVQGGAGLPERLVSRHEHTRAATWLEGTWRVGDAVSTQAGLRVDRVGLTGETRFSPRASATWGVGQSTRVRAAVGRYTQSPGYEKLAQGDYLLDLTDVKGRGLVSQRATIASFGIERDLTGVRASFRIEGFYKRFGDILVGQLESETARLSRIARYDFPGELAASIPTRPIVTSLPTNDSRGRAYGVDVQLTRMGPTDARVRGWASYTWSRAERDAYGLRYPFEYDRRHAASLVAAYRLGRRFEVAATARVASGFPRTAPLGLRVAGVVDEADADRDGIVEEIVPERDADGRLVYAVDFGGIENLQRRRLPYYARVDARLSWRSGSGSWEVYAEALNVLNRKNAGQLSPQLEHDSTSDRPRLVENREQSIPLLPTIGLRFRF